MFCLSQTQGSATISWTAVSDYTFGDNHVRIPQFGAANFHYDVFTRSVQFQLKIPVTSPVDPASLQLRDIVYENIPASQLGDLKPASVPTSPNAKARLIRARETQSLYLALSPIIKEANSYKRITSFSYSFSNNSRPAPVFNNVASISNSVLASGNWYRFYVEKSGVYKISKSFLQSLGMDTSGDPRTIKIYGNGGRMIPLANSVPYPFDLAENAIQFVGEDDGQFNNDDYILFYAEGVDNWNADSQTFNNLYADRSYYYVTSGGATGKRIQPLDPLSGSAATLTLTQYDDQQYHERDLYNVARVGRRWFGEQFGVQNEQTFDFNLPNIDTSTPINIAVYGAGISAASSFLKVEANGQQVGNIGFSPVIPNSGTEADPSSLPAGTTFPASQNVSVKLTYDNGGVPTAKAFVDWIILNFKSNLTGYGKQFRFTYNAAATQTGVAQYQFSNASGISQVWDITDIYNVSGTTNGGDANFSFKAALGEARQYIAVVPGDYYTPSKESKTRVANLDLKGTIFNNAQGQFQDIDYLIVTPSSLHAQAEKLATFHRGNSGLNVKVVNLEDIYQEFGSGKQDIGAIRNFVKYVYDNASSAAARVKYLNLFGDASFDPKDRIPNNTNIVPIYEALNSYTSGESSFCSDDFFALMDADEGRIDGFGTGTDFGGADIATGRIVADDAQQADEMVNKVIEYYDIKSYGNWRNNLTFIADDSDKASDATLQTRQNNLADAVWNNKPFFNIDKILLDSYVEESSAGGKRYPKARQDLFDAFERGCLIFNYLGHGGQDGLSGERIWEKSDGQNLQNTYKYPLFVTITCEFSWFDNPYRPTAGEYTYWNPRGGAIAMMTTIRSIGQSAAEDFNDVISQYLLNYGAGAGGQTTIAEALRQAKNHSSNSASNVVVFIGDPALMLAIPKPKVRLTKVNGQPITGPIPDFQALAPMTITGEVTDENDVPIPTYNGQLAVNIFDKNITRATLNNDGFAPTISFNTLGETIFRGNASVTAGNFEFSFVVPRDIRVPLGNGRISFYARRNVTGLDKTGYDTTIKIGGINQNAVADNIGPTVKLYMNDTSFISGGITNENPIFLAYLQDEHGINTASGIGHDIIGILDGDESNPYVMNDYYETELNDYTHGIVRYPFRNLAKGLHTLTFQAWDVYNNPVTAEIQFVVVGDETLTLTHVLNYPNPFSTYTQFWFTHNHPFEPLEVQVQVVTVTGKVVWTKNQTVTTDGFLCRDITWDGRDDFGDRIGKGVYIYKLTVRSTVSGTKSEKYEKLVIL